MKKTLLFFSIFILTIFVLISCDPFYYVDISDTNVYLNKDSYSPGETIKITFSGNLKEKEKITGLDFYFFIKRYNENNETEYVDDSDIIISDENLLEYETKQSFNNSILIKYRKENVIVNFTESFLISINNPGKYELYAYIDAALMRTDYYIPEGHKAFIIPFEVE